MADSTSRSGGLFAATGTKTARADIRRGTSNTGCDCINSGTGEDKRWYATQEDAAVACEASRKRHVDGDTLNTSLLFKGRLLACWK
jgi:hypothetical protein